MKYVPHDYQAYATEFVLSHPTAAILLQMGLGKSVITLTAIRELLEKGEVRKVLVIAPLRVARDTWPEEIQKWDHLWGISYAVAVGSPEERRAALDAGASNAGKICSLISLNSRPMSLVPQVTARTASRFSLTIQA